MTFFSAMENLLQHSDWRETIVSLRRYLDERGFQSIYKHHASAARYHLFTSIFSSLNPDFLRLLSERPGEGFPGCRLACCLTARRSVDIVTLDEEEAALAARLADIGLVAIRDGIITPGEVQLIGAEDCYVLIDAAIHFRMKRVHEIYIGADTMLLMHYLPDSGNREGRMALDACSGSGVVGLHMAKSHERVVSTDIASAPLALIRVNAVLNGVEERISVRKEALADTLSSGSRYDLVVCNPPFVAFPRGFGPPVYAAGTEQDGLGYLRLLLEKVPALLRPEGEGYFVADLPGDGLEPHFFRELSERAIQFGFVADAFVDNRVPADIHVKAMSGFLGALKPEADPGDIVRLTREFVEQTLNATHFYLTTMRIRKSSSPGFRAFNQFGARRFEDYFAGGKIGK